MYEHHFGLREKPFALAPELIAEIVQLAIARNAGWLFVAAVFHGAIHADNTDAPALVVYTGQGLAAE